MGTPRLILRSVLGAGAVFALMAAPAGRVDAQNPLPAPTHPIFFGYYYSDGRYGDRTAEVFGYNDLYMGGALYAGTPWQPALFQQSLQNAFDQNKNIYLLLGYPNPDLPTFWNEALDIAAPYWSRVQLCELYDEPDWDQAQTESWAVQFKNMLTAKGLAQKPVGVVYFRDQTLPGTVYTTDSYFAPSLDWVGIECYVDAPKQNDADIVDYMNTNIDTAMARIPAGKEIVLVMQSYDRNGNWTNIPSLRTLEEPVYLKAYSNPRVIGITMFSYARPGGSRDHPELKAHHRRIADKLGVYTPPAVTLTGPTAGQAFTAPATVNFAATATPDADVLSASVEFYQGNAKVGEDTNGADGWSFAWAGVAAGTYTVKAVLAYYGTGMSASATANITVSGSGGGNQSPTVSLTAPLAGQTFTAPAAINLAATAADADGTVAQVEFFQGSTLLGQDTTSPYAFAWSGAAAGSYSLTARATDNAGAARTSAAVSVTVTSGGGATDSDGDGLTDADEAARGTNPNIADTDADGMGDGREVTAGFSPLSADQDVNGRLDGQDDWDADGTTNQAELMAGTPAGSAPLPAVPGGGGGGGGGCFADARRR